MQAVGEPVWPRRTADIHIPVSGLIALEDLSWPVARCGGLSRTMTAVTGALLGALMILTHCELLDSHTLTVPSSDPAPHIEPKHHSLNDAFFLLPVA